LRNNTIPNEMRDLKSFLSDKAGKDEMLHFVQHDNINIKRRRLYNKRNK